MTSILEAWANPPYPIATVPAGAAAANPGDVELWDMGGGYTQFPAATPDTWPPVLFRAFDLRDPLEVFRVLDTVSAPGRWQVMRGDQGSTPTAHAPGFTVLNAITGDGLTQLAQGVPSGNGLVLPAAGRKTAATAPGSVWNQVAVLPVPAGEPTPGSVYELFAWGYYWAQVNMTMDGRMTWAIAGQIDNQGVNFGSQAVGVPNNIAANNTARWRAHGYVTFYEGPPDDQPANGNLILTAANGNSTGGNPPGTDGQGQNEWMMSRTPTEPPNPPTVDTTGGGELRLLVSLLAGNAGNSGITVQGSKAWRAG